MMPLLFALALPLQPVITHRFSCVGNPDVNIDGHSKPRTMHVTFVEQNRKITNITVVNPPLFDGGQSTNWRAKRTKSGYRILSTKPRKRYSDGEIEPGLLNIIFSADRQINQIEWRASFIGGHLAFDDTGTGTCRHTIEPNSGKWAK